MIEVELPDGRIVEFPDGTSREVMKGAMNKLSMRDRISAAKAGTLQMKPGSSERAADADNAAMVSMRDPGAAASFALGASQGATLGFGDEIVGGAAAAGGVIKDAVTGNFSGMADRMGQRYAENRDLMRDAKDDASAARPKTAFAGELVGGMALPIPALGQSATVGKAALKGAAVGAAYGGAYGFGTGEGGTVERLKDGLEGAVSGGIIGGAAPVVINGISRGLQAVFKKSAERPSIESLRSAKSAAYRAVDEAGEVFTPDEMSMLATKAREAVEGADNFLPEVDAATVGMLKKLETMSTRESTLGQVDKLRRAIWDRYNTTKEGALLEVIDAIDEMVSGRASTSSLLDAARLANARYKKAELLDLAFQKAKDQTAATGSGGNVLNKMRQAVVSIINNPKQAKWFNEAEIEAMRNFSRGTMGENAARLIGKLAPTGNGLMTALNLGAVAANPSMLAVSAMASGTKGLSDRAAQRGAERLIGMMGGQAQVQRPVYQMPRQFNALAGIAGNQE